MPKSSKVYRFVRVLKYQAQKCFLMIEGRHRLRGRRLLCHYSRACCLLASSSITSVCANANCSVQLPIMLLLVLFHTTASSTMVVTRIRSASILNILLLSVFFINSVFQPFSALFKFFCHFVAIETPRFWFIPALYLLYLSGLLQC